MFKQIRSMLGHEKSGPIGGFNGKVEVDETYYGSRSKGTASHRGRENEKTPVVGMVSVREGSSPLSLPMLRPTLCVDSSREHVLPNHRLYR